MFLCKCKNTFMFKTYASLAKGHEERAVSAYPAAEADTEKWVLKMR